MTADIEECVNVILPIPRQQDRYAGQVIGDETPWLRQSATQSDA
jgi:hypothetical protein